MSYVLCLMSYDCVLQMHHQLEQSPYFFMDVLYIHELPSEENNCEVRNCLFPMRKINKDQTRSECISGKFSLWILIVFPFHVCRISLHVCVSWTTKACRTFWRRPAWRSSSTVLPCYWPTLYRDLFRDRQTIISHPHLPLRSRLCDVRVCVGESVR
jgi:hypothetical protein